MTICKEVHHEGYIEILQKFFDPMHRYLQVSANKHELLSGILTMVSFTPTDLL